MKPHRIRMAHNLILHYGLANMMEVRLAHSHVRGWDGAHQHALATPLSHGALQLAGMPAAAGAGKCMVSTCASRCTDAWTICMYTGVQTAAGIGRGHAGLPCRGLHRIPTQCVHRKQGCPPSLAAALLLGLHWDVPQETKQRVTNAGCRNSTRTRCGASTLGTTARCSRASSSTARCLHASCWSGRIASQQAA